MPQINAHITTLSESPAYSSAADKLRQLQATESRLKAEISEIEARLKQDQTPGIIREYAVQALLASNEYHHSPGKSELNSQLTKLREEFAVVRAAITEQHQTVNSEGAKASSEICKGIRPQYDAALSAMVLGLLGAQQAASIAAQIRDRLDSDNVSLTSLPTLTFPEIGRAAVDECSRLSYLVREALTLELIERSDVPAEWLRHWGI